MDYRETLNLPKTDFPMKADLPQREPEILKRWKEQDIYRCIMEKRKKAKNKYILHDGPPYSNGNIHMGHVLNKVLKDMVVKSHTMMQNNVPFVPGWDCHGLPVEHQLMKELQIEKGDISQVEFREKAREFALKYVRIQKSEFERLGVFGDWENPYLTLDPQYEAVIVRSFAKLVGRGYIYKDLKPVNWCYRCETALAEAEVEYEMHTSPSIFVSFELEDVEKFRKLLNEEVSSQLTSNVYVLIWTTTPWTLIANVAIALSPSMKYALIKDSKARYFILARDLLEAVSKKVGLVDAKVITSFYGSDLEGLNCLHPFINRKSKIVLAEYVSHEEGTGCVHTAPGHGQEDYITGKKYNLPTVMPVDSKGRLNDSTGEFKGMHVFGANEKIIAKLDESGSLIYAENLQHSYPHCWRCKNPIIFRATEQYFMNVDYNGLRSKIEEVIVNRVKWMPETGKERISAMVKIRPDWCLSRQRLWGVPIVAFYCTNCNELLFDEAVINYVSDIFEKEGSDAWFTKKTKDFIPKGERCKKCKNDTFEKENDILDVWFESGVSHQAVLKPRKEYPADLYLEGSDQHRGWFQSAIISSIAIDGIAPYRAVLTHGFVVDGEGKKMSKSLGNVISPEDVMKRYGADILRLWVASCDYSCDVRLSEEILSRLAEAYRKIRNTCRFILGNLYDFDPEKDTVSIEKWPEIDRWAIWRTSLLLEAAEENFKNFNFHKAFSAIHNFCIVDMSSIYMDVLKDRLYVSGKNSILRRSAQSALFEIITMLCKIMAPIFAYTAEEIWQSLHNGSDANKSIHLEDWPDIKVLKTKLANTFKEKDMQRWSERLLPLRERVLKELEKLRCDDVIGSSLEAEVILYSDDKDLQKIFDESKNLLSALFIVSSVEIAKDLPEDGNQTEGIKVAIKVTKAKGRKCQRCWNYSMSVGEDSKHPELCARCRDMIESNINAA